MVKIFFVPGCSVLLNHKVHAVIGVLGDDTDPMVSVMKLEKAPQESYADVGGLDTQIQEIKESVELPLTHPELYEEMGIKPPKGVILYGSPGTGKTLLAKVPRAASFIPLVFFPTRLYSFSAPLFSPACLVLTVWY